MLELYGEKLNSHLIIGSAKYPSLTVMEQAIIAAKSELVTIALRRLSPEKKEKNQFWETIKRLNIKILPNTSGCYHSKEAVQTALLARELFSTNWIKLEIFGDSYTLQPNPFELLKATEELIKLKFCVFPYMTDDLVLAKELVNLGCEVLMPWASPIGSGKGILNPYYLKILRERFPKCKLIIDAGIGCPSHAAYAMELGMDGVLLNSAIATSHDPVMMAKAFALGIESGKLAFQSGLMPESDFAQPSSPILGVPFRNEQ